MAAHAEAERMDKKSNSGDDEADAADDAIQHLRAILCEVSKERAKEVLEAASGSIERAVEIYFQQQQQGLQRQQFVVETSDDDIIKIAEILN